MVMRRGRAEDKNLHSNSSTVNDLIDRHLNVQPTCTRYVYLQNSLNKTRVSFMYPCIKNSLQVKYRSSIRSINLQFILQLVRTVTFKYNWPSYILTDLAIIFFPTMSYVGSYPDFSYTLIKLTFISNSNNFAIMLCFGVQSVALQCSVWMHNAYLEPN